jgi:putative ABC transport system permease protein
MSVIWAKVWRDLAHNKARTLLVVLSTAVGVFALGLIFGLSGEMRARMTEGHRATLPGHINFFGVSPFEEQDVEALRREAGVADAEGQIHSALRWKLEGETEWRDGNLVARAGYTAQRMDLVTLSEGQWPAGHTLAVEYKSSQHFNIPLGTTIVVERGRREQRLPITGIIRMSIGFFSPPQIGGDATFFATPETVAWLTGGDEGFNQLNVRLESFSRQAANALARRLERRLERMEISVGSHTITDPKVHWLQAQADTMFLILGVLGALALGLSALLIVNTMNAIVAQQVWQIGVMKVVGATFGRVMRIYLATALAYGIFALLLAVPLGAIAAHGMAAWLLDLMGFAAGSLQIVSSAAGIQVMMGLAVPLLAALLPVIGGARITPHQAISSYGLGSGFGRGWLDRLAGRIRCLPRMLTLSLRNTFRRKGRVALTLATLVFGGALFIVVMSVRSSLNNTLEVVLRDFDLDVLVRLSRPQRAEYLAEVTGGAPGVLAAEVWDRQAALLAIAEGNERTVYLWGIPPGSRLFHPRIIGGRGLLPGDRHAILLNSKIATDEGFRVGDEIRLTIGSQESDWTVVGLILNVGNNQQDNFVPFDTLTREAGHLACGAIVAVVSTQRDREGQQALVNGLRRTYAARHIETILLLSADELWEQNRTQFDVIIYLLLTMAALAALVGSIGLTGMLSINVVERRREIGVMRAIGATSPTIAGIFVSEGVLLGVWSWMLAVPLSIPGARLFSRAVGTALLQAALEFRYSLGGMLMWLLIVIALSALASLWPAIGATRVSVREALTYE